MTIDINSQMWMVRAEKGGRLIDEFLIKGVVAIGWNEIGDMINMNSRETIKEALRKEYNYKEAKINVTAGQLKRFRLDFKVNDYVISYDSEERVYHIGQIISDYKYEEDVTSELNHIRDVKWIDKVHRDSFSTSAKNTLGSALTIIEINNDVKKEIRTLLSGEETLEEGKEEESEELDIIKEEIKDKAREFIKDKVSDLDWEDMEQLVAGLLRAMGYKTRITPRGPDRGRDVIASPDGLGLEDPRIIVEVKHRKGQMGSSALRSFTGGLRSRDKGLYVSTGGFSKEAKYEAERSTVPITLIDIDSLVDLIIQYYDEFDVETKALIPLQKIYWPA